MKYRITYMLKSQNISGTYDFVVDDIDVDIENDSELFDLALRDSAKYHQSGTCSVNITNTEPVE